MATRAYSFLDIAVLEEVRTRFAEAEALVILAPDLEEVIWANGAGAGLLGHPDIEAVMGADARLGPVARRQISSIPGFPGIGRDRPVAVRIASGATSRIIGFTASGIILPGGETAILLAAADVAARSLTPAERAARAIEGFAEEGHYAAILDAAGGVVAARNGFKPIAPAAETLSALVTEIAAEPDRLLKRMIPGAHGAVAAGLARLTDDPALHLLILVDATAEEAEPSPHAHSDTAGIDGDAVTPPLDNAEEPDTSGADLPAKEAVEASREPGPAAGGRGRQREGEDHWYFSDDGQRPSAGSVADAMHGLSSAGGTPPGVPDGERISAVRESRPVRFVWRTDEDGRFSAVSPEFVGAVGRNASDVVGRKFRDVALTFALDPTNEIADLLDRRDTWSGRSVFWPIEGTDLKVPVDLAALPIYGRDRKFEGFRGFGVARMADAIIDPDELGLALVQNRAEDVSEAKQPGGSGPLKETDAGSLNGDAELDPFRGEVPALKVAPQPDRRYSDKVIRLAEHRAPQGPRELTPVEHSAFKEIATRLREHSVDREPSDGLPEEEKGRTNTAGPAGGGTIARATGETVDVPLPEESDDQTAAERPAPENASDEATSTSDPSSAAPTDAGERPVHERNPTTTQDVAEPMALAIVPGKSDTGDEPDEAKAAGRQSAEPDRTGDQGAPDRPEIVPAAFAGRTEGSSESRFGTEVLDRLPVPLIVHSGDVLHFANRELLELTGFDSIGDLAEAGGLGALFDEPYVDPESGERTLRLRTVDGGELPVGAMLQSIPWEDGKALLLSLRREPISLPETDAGRQQSVGTVLPPRDETGDLETRLEELRTIIDTATDGVVIIDNGGTIRSISRPAEALFGYDSHELAGRQFVSLFAIESQRAARDYLGGLSDNGVASILNDGREVIGREAQGRFIPLFMTIGRLPGNEGFCAVLRDITQWKRAEEELTQARAQAEYASSQKTEFLARVSHEIRTPLNAIIGFSELMIDEKFGPLGNERYRDYLRDINRSGNHVLDLVNDLLDISKIEAGQQDLSFEAVSLNDTLGETVAMMQPQANRDRVIIRSSFASRLPAVVADLRSVRQIALNLLSNAIRYTPAGGQVIVSTSYEASGDILLRIRDTGIGMSNAEIEQAMKPFKQLNTLKRARGDGTGLGLPLTKALVEANRARFSIVSVSGEGTLVEVVFPSTRVLAE